MRRASRDKAASSTSSCRTTAYASRSIPRPPTGPVSGSARSSCSSRRSCATPRSSSTNDECHDTGGEDRMTDDQNDPRLFPRARYLLALAVWSLCAGRALAQQLPADLTQLPLEELMSIDVVYGASKHDQKVTEAPSFVSVVTSEDIARYGYRTLADVLRSVHGFYTTYDRNYTYLGVRGFSRPSDYNSRFLLLVDGHRINDNFYGSAYIGTEEVIDVDLIDRVEIIRGPSSSLYGTSAFFAVINVITLKQGDVPRLQLSGTGASYGTPAGRVNPRHAQLPRREVRARALGEDRPAGPGLFRSLLLSRRLSLLFALPDDPSVPRALLGRLVRHRGEAHAEAGREANPHDRAGVPRQREAAFPVAKRRSRSGRFR